MLKSLQIKNYVLIDSLDVDFPEGLIIISGQTGAGKSILLGALSLVLGSKADSSVIGNDADSCVVEAVFGVPKSDSLLRDILRENDVEADEDELIIRRVVNRSGRSRSFINDAPVSVQVLQGISARLVDIHSQHQTLLLSDKVFQLSMLDHYAGNEELLEECSDAFKSFKSLEKELASVTERLTGLSEEQDYIRSRYQRLEDARLQEGEIESLEAEQKRLANAEEIKECLSGVEELFNPSDPNSDAMSMSSALKEAKRMLERVGGFVPQAYSLAERIESARAELDDILNTQPLDEDAARSLICKLAQEQYDTIGNEEYETERLRRLFTAFECAAELNAELLQSAVSAVLVTRQTVRLQLKNGQIIGKEDLV